MNLDKAHNKTICMGPTGNIHGSYKFYCLRTKKKLTRCRWDEMPMLILTTKKIESLAAPDKVAVSRELNFANQNYIPLAFNNKEYDK